MAAQWLYMLGKTKKGPISEDELIARLEDELIAPETLVWTKGMKKWQPAVDVDGLYEDAEPQSPIEKTQPSQPARPAIFAWSIRKPPRGDSQRKPAMAARSCLYFSHFCALVILYFVVIENLPHWNASGALWVKLYIYGVYGVPIIVFQFFADSVRRGRMPAIVIGLVVASLSGLVAAGAFVLIYTSYIANGRQQPNEFSELAIILGANFLFALIAIARLIKALPRQHAPVGFAVNMQQ